MMTIHNNNTFKVVLLLLLCRGIMAYNNTDHYILILGESVSLLVILKIRTVAIDSIRTNLLTIEQYIIIRIYRIHTDD